MGVLRACMSVHHARKMPVEARSKHGTPGMGVTHSCEPLMWYREVNPGLRQEQTPMLATSRAISPSPRVNVYRAMMIHIWSPVIRKAEARLLGRKQDSELSFFFFLKSENGLERG